MSYCPGCGYVHDHNRLASKVATLELRPHRVTLVEDDILAVLDRWTNGGHPVIAGEVKRRRDYYQALADQFTNPQPME